jgi:hypothetical protein
VAGLSDKPAAPHHAPPRHAAASPRPDPLRPALAATESAPRPRLRLEAAAPVARPEVVVVEQALEAVAEAASAARHAASAASAAAERIAMLERTVDQLRSEAQGGRDQAALLRERLARSEDAARWMWPMVGFLLLLAGLAAWLAARLASAQRAHQEGWRSAALESWNRSVEAPPRSQPGEGPANKEATAPIPFVTSEIKLPPAGAAAARAPAGWPSMAAGDARRAPAPAAAPSQAQGPVPEERGPERTEVLPSHVRAEDHAPRDVTIEELIDLEQQADFFVVLGQDSAAIELLVEHLRHTGGGSPLPYLKLLELYRQRGSRADYERMRSRFNHRFNAYAPEWEADLQAGRSLEDYRGVIPRLQQVWTRPLDAMAELEALLFRKSRGELFDLPAYREVLFLYSLARDLLDREAADTGNVDLLLPLSDGAPFGSTAPAPFLGLEPDALSADGDAEAPPTRPVDFDVSVDAERPVSIFDPLEQLQPLARQR